MIPDFVTWDARCHGESYAGPTPFFRPIVDNDGRRDRDIWQSIFVEDEYRTPFFKNDDVVLDIGMHIGSFSCLAYMRGSRNVHGYEVDEGAAETAAANALYFEDQRYSPFPQITVNHAAVVGGLYPPKTVRYTPGSMQIGQGSGVADAVPFDSIVTTLGRIRFLKMDCEGSEFPILSTSKCLDQVDQISGEFHEGAPFPEYDCTMKGLAESLSRWGFYVYYEDRKIGNFFAKRTPFEGQ